MSLDLTTTWVSDRRPRPRTSQPWLPQTPSGRGGGTKPLKGPALTLPLSIRLTVAGRRIDNRWQKAPQTRPDETWDRRIYAGNGFSHLLAAPSRLGRSLWLEPPAIQAGLVFQAMDPGRPERPAHQGPHPLSAFGAQSCTARKCRCTGYVLGRATWSSLGARSSIRTTLTGLHAQYRVYARVAALTS